jgi:hypothetical protein
MSTFPAVPCLPYDVLRPQVRSGDILLCSGSAVFSKLIQHATNSVWSHCGFLLHVEAIDRLLVLESVESIGVRAVPLSHYCRTYNGTATGYPGRVYIARHAAFITKDLPQLVHAAQGAVDLFGYPYDTKEILDIAARIVAAKLGMAPEPFVRNGVFICSEYLWNFLDSLSITLPYNLAGFFSPDDVATCPEVAIVWEMAIDT